MAIDLGMFAATSRRSRAVIRKVLPAKPAVDPDTIDRVRRNNARRALSWSSRTWGFLDFIVAGSGFVLAHALSPQFRFLSHGHGHAYSVTAATFAFASLLVFFNCMLGTYDRHNFTAVGRMAAQTIFATTLALAMTGLGIYGIEFASIGRLIVILTLFISGGGTFCCRMIARGLARKAKIRLMLVGSKRKFRTLATQIRAHHFDFYERPSWLDLADTSVTDRRAVFAAAFARHKPDEVIVMDSDPALSDVLHHSPAVLKSGCAIYTYVAYCENLLNELPIESVDDRGVLGTGFNIGSFHTGLTKRPIDVGLAGIALIAAMPLLGFCALAIKLNDGGPVLYRQRRVGRYGKVFTIFKFRTMRVDSEKSGAKWAAESDPRVTGVGRFLRSTRLDELPQIFNIIRGEMSFVGPRPERPEFVNELRLHIPHYDLRLLVPPGLTGWAQIRFRYGATMADAERKLAFDLYYVRRCSLLFDLVIWVRTVAAVAKGAR
jgi:exopolysaccharide biosynthesis polyprenyl glycosylphosphotransferase